MFREDFVWGVASSAYQVEGTDAADGRGACVWDMFAADGRVFEHQNADTSCDHMHHYKEDIALMKHLGIRAYRFSLNWARILPEGTGRVNEKAIAMYRDMILTMKENGITPYLTLFHWEFPQALYERGGWQNPDVVQWFGEYAKVVAENFSDICEYFITINEPQCVVGLGHLSGVHAPGVKLPVAQTFLVAHHLLMAHGQAVINLRRYAVRPVKIGFAPTGGVAYPYTDRPEDIEAAKKVYFGFYNPIDNWTWNVSWFSDPVFLGHYPEEGLKKFAPYLPEITKEGQRLQGKTKSEIKIECMKAERDVRRRLGNKILDAIHNSICMEEGNRVPLDSEELSDGGNRVPLGSEELSDGGNRVPSMKQSNDIVKMIKDFKKLADSPEGNIYAAYRLGCIYMDKENSEHYDAGKAIKYLEKASDSAEENVYAAYRLGCIYMDKEDPEHYDTEKAIAYLEKAVENPEGNVYAAYRLGCIYMDETMPESCNLQKGIQFLEKAALQHNPDAEIKLGIAYYFGKGVLKDKERGEQYLQAAIADGSEYAQNILDAGGLNVAYCLTKSVLSGLETMNRQQTYYNNQQSHSRQALREKQLHSDQNRDI